MRRWFPVVLVAATAVYAGTVAGAWSWSTDGGLATDAAFDWVAVHAITGPGTPHDDLHLLFRDHGFTAPVELHGHPRLPGALLLQLPYLAVGLEDALAVMGVVTVLSACVLWWAAVKLTGWTPLLVALLCVLAVLSPPFTAAFAHGSQGPLVAALTAVAWVQRRGGWLGVAAVLKLFPALLIVMLWKRPRIMWWGVGVFTGLNLVGLLLPDVTATGTLGAFLSAQKWNALNPLNFGAPVWATVAGTVALVVVAKWLTVDQVFIVGSVGMVLLSPTVWVHYLVVLFVPLVVGVSTLRGFPRQERRHRRSTVVADKEPDSGWATSQKRGAS